MTNRILNWFFNGNPDMQAFYAETDYSPEQIRLYTPSAPGAACKVDIRDDGVSILEHYAELGGQETLEEAAGTFPNTLPSIEAGSIITCHIIDPGGVTNLSVQFEMETLADEDEEIE